MPTFSTENTLSLEPKSPPGPLACSTIYFLLTSPPLQAYARTKQHLLCKTKPISKGLLMSVTSALTSTYEEKPPLEAPKNKANSKPIGKKAATLAKLHQIRATSSDLLSSVPIRHLWPGFLRYSPPRAHKTIPNYAKQSQFPKASNDCNLNSNKHLRRKTTPGGAKKQSQSPKRPKMNLTAYAAKDYEKISAAPTQLPWICWLESFSEDLKCLYRRGRPPAVCALWKAAGPNAKRSGIL